MENQSLITLTDKAVEQIKSIYSKETSVEKGLRLSVVGGGCSGLSYKIDFSEVREKDNVLEFNGFKVLIDPKSSIYLRGITLDFQDGLKGKGFIFENPNAKNTCGCGESFTV